jgi:hypothetical protein
MITTTRCIAWLYATSPGVALANAAEHTALVSGPDLPLPSIWRVLLVLLMAGAIAFAATALLKQLKPWLAKKGITTPASGIGVVSHRKLARGLDVYVIAIEQQHYMIVHSPHSTVVTRVDDASESSASKVDVVTGHQAA